MIDLNLVSNVILIVVAIINLIAMILIVRELISGSYKRYIEKRTLHLEQLHRVQEELKKARIHD